MEDDDLTIDTDSAAELGGSEDDLEAIESRVDTKMIKLRRELEREKREKQEHLDGWQRAKADYVNALKRFDEEKRIAVELGTLKAAAAFLPAIDSLERAKEVGQLPEGFAGIVKQLEAATAKLDLSQFGAVGDKFNPAIHEALGQDATDHEDEDDTITAILEPGWKSGEHVIRPAKARVAHFEG